MKLYVLMLSLVLLIYAGVETEHPACIVFCDDRSMVEAGYRVLWEGSAGTEAVASADHFLASLQANVASPYRWCDLGEALLHAHKEQMARYCIDRAVALGPDIPPILLRAANFHLNIQEPRQALIYLSRFIQQGTLESFIFDNYYDRFGFGASSILQYGIPTARVARLWFLHLLDQKKDVDLNNVWFWMNARNWADDVAADKYLRYLAGTRQYETATEVWSVYKKSGKEQRNAVLNGDFEQDLSGFIFDWNITATAGVEVTRDSKVAHSGNWSLRLQFDGKENVEYHHTSQLILVSPGTYSFQGFVKTDAVSTDQGIGFRILNPDSPGLLDIKIGNVTGTTDWQGLQQKLTVGPKAAVIEVQVIRKPSMQFDNKITGTAWIDTIALTPAM